jgi:hypothetical protein
MHARPPERIGLSDRKMQRTFEVKSIAQHRHAAQHARIVCINSVAACFKRAVMHRTPLYAHQTN